MNIIVTMIVTLVYAGGAVNLYGAFREQGEGVLPSFLMAALWPVTAGKALAFAVDKLLVELEVARGRDKRP